MIRKPDLLTYAKTSIIIFESYLFDDRVTKLIDAKLADGGFYLGNMDDIFTLESAKEYAFSIMLKHYCEASNINIELWPTIEKMHPLNPYLIDDEILNNGLNIIHGLLTDNGFHITNNSLVRVLFFNNNILLQIHYTT